jgi:hypothetical protein
MKDPQVLTEFMYTGPITTFVIEVNTFNRDTWKDETQAFEEIPGRRHVKLKKFSFDPHVSYFKVT